MALAKNIIAISVSLMIIFLLATTLVIPFFTTTYEEGFGTATRDDSTDVVNEYCITNSSLVACTDCNNTDVTSTGYETFLSTCHSLVSRSNGTHCWSCSDFGFRTVSRGLMLLIFVLGLVALGLVFVKYRW